MTCVVGLVDGARVLIGADSAGLSGWHLTVRSDPKVFESHGFLYGFSGVGGGTHLRGMWECGACVASVS